MANDKTDWLTVAQRWVARSRAATPPSPANAAPTETPPLGYEAAHPQVQLALWEEGVASERPQPGAWR
ncbi:hypothetical protein [Caldimonas aquatica]|uniref:Uncharacterized protein n=1 Tax=Caldimonas aquatica TaxID=376175 RepID=A0ABY6MR98_9BURK|nr:hypothetical protein [Schlegelella aquatica]UZD54536.1 hypothetical protein OMP39_12840 [Schlegelella aquatica]